MLTIKKAFEKLMKLLRSIKPVQPLPIRLEPFLWERMEEFSPANEEVLVAQGEVPKYAYYIIRGYIHLYFICDKGIKHVARFYKEDRIVALLSFLERKKSPCYIIAGRDTLLSRVSHQDMQEIYDSMEGMKEFAMLTVLEHDHAKEQLRESIRGLAAEERVLKFYRVYGFLLPAERARLDEEIASYLGMAVRTLVRHRTKLISDGLI